MNSYASSSAVSNAFLTEQGEEIDDEAIESDAYDTLCAKTKPTKKTRPGFEDSAAKRTTNIMNMANGQNPVMPEPSMYMRPLAGNMTGAEKPTIATEGRLRCGPKNPLLEAMSSSISERLIIHGKKECGYWQG